MHMMEMQIVDEAAAAVPPVLKHESSPPVGVGAEEAAAASAVVVSVRRMNSSSDGKTTTGYADNSDFQRVIASVTKKARQELAAGLYRALHLQGRPGSMAIADLGCASGPNALLMVSDAVDAVLTAEVEEEEEGKGKGIKERPQLQLQVFLNDLPGNDFNAVFRLLPSSKLAAAGCCFVSAWPGSFYERVFPDDSLDYVVSSSSLHFLSKAPTMSPEHPNLGRVYISESSPSAVLEAYRTQFHGDFVGFLRCRAAETRLGGLLLLTFVARRTARPTAHDCYLWDLLADALMAMAAAGRLLVVGGEDRVHAFDAPFYAPCPYDLAAAVAEEGSFAVRTLQLFDTTRRRRQGEEEDGEWLPRWLAVETASTVRAVVEPMLRAHFGWDAMDELFCRYRLLLQAYYRCSDTRNKDDLTNVFLVLEKKQQ